MRGATRTLRPNQPELQTDEEVRVWHRVERVDDPPLPRAVASRLDDPRLGRGAFKQKAARRSRHRMSGRKLTASNSGVNSDLEAKPGEEPMQVCSHHAKPCCRRF